MSTLKKIVSLTLALAMLMSVSVFADFADQGEIDASCVEAVNLLTAVNLIKGKTQNEDGTYDFEPKATITRAEAAKMIYVLRNGGVDDKAAEWKSAVSFTDCKDHWAAGYIAYCEHYNLVNGYNGMFDPEKPVTGVALAKMLLTVAGYKTEVEGYTGTAWEKNVVNDADAAGIFKGCKFAISEPAPRQWAAKMFVNAFETNVPVYIGDYRVDTGIGIGTTTVAKKFLSLNSKIDVVVANDVWGLDGTKAASGKTKLKTNGTVSFDVANELVGQQVTVAWNDANDNDAIDTEETVYGITATGKSISGTATTGRTGSSGNYKYTLTAGGKTYKEAEVNGATFRVVNANVNNSGKDLSSIQKLYTAVAGKTTAISINVYDVDGNGKLEASDYVIVSEAQYSEVTAYSTSDKSYTLGTNALKVNKDGKVVVGSTVTSEVITTEGTLALGGVVKVTKDYITGKRTVAEVKGEIALFNGIAGDKYTLGSTQYTLGTDLLTGGATWLDAENLGKLTTYYTDGKYIIKAVEFDDGDDEDTTADVLTDKLAMLIAAKAIEVKTTEENSWTTNVTTSYVPKVQVLLANGLTRVFEYETKAKNIKTGELTATDLFGTATFNAANDDILLDAFETGIYEYRITADGNIVLKASLSETKNVQYHVNNAGNTVPTISSTKYTGRDVGYDASKKLFTVYNSTTALPIMATDSTLVFAIYTNEQGEIEYKTVKMSEFTDDVNHMILIASSTGSISNALLVKVSYSYSAAVDAGEAYVYTTTAAELKVHTDGKVYAFFNAIDLNNPGAPITYKADKSLYGNVAKNTIYNLETEDGKVTEANAENWTAKSVSEKIGGLLIVSGELWETTGSDSKFASNVKVIVKNGSTYTVGTVADIGKAALKSGKTDEYENNILVKFNNAGKVSYVIVEADGKIG